MPRQILIGKEGSQPFAIIDPKVSRRHAILNIADNGQLMLIDNGSTNGTYIYNGSTFVRLTPNQPYPVRPDTMMRLGTETQFHVRKLIAQQGHGGGGGQNPPQPPKPPKVKKDISHLRMVSENYDANKLAIESKTSMINGLRSFTILITMGAAAASSFLISSEDPQDKPLGTILSFGIALVLMTVLLVIINVYNKKLMQRRRDNEHEYAVRYVCPECKASFRGKIYENILAERCCPRCKTEYYEAQPQYPPYPR